MCRAEEENSDVVVLTTDTFDDFVKEHKYVLAEFYAPWCGHCKALAPEYEKAATALKESNSDVKLAKIDATVEKDLGTRFAVQGYPTLLWFVSGDKFEYKGGRTADTIIQWISKKTGPAVGTGEVPTPAGQAVVVLKGKTITNDFNKVANALGDDAVFHFIESDAADVIEIHHKEEDLIVASDSDKADLAAFVNKHLMPKFGNLDGETYGKYMSSGKGLVWVLMDIASSEELAGAADAARPTFIKLAKKFPQYNFAYIDTVMFKAAVENMLGVSEFPAIAVNQKAGDKKKFILPGELEEATISKFLNDVEAGKVEPTLKSEEVPESNEEPVRVIVGKTLKEEVFAADKDVLFEVYAPWCGHCKKLAPEYEKVAQKIRKEGLEDLITIAKMDGTTNDSPIDSISWEGFPTLFYIKAGSTEPEPFNGGRDAKSIWKWIKKNHSKSDEIAKRLAEKKDESKEDSSEEGKDEL
jgi:protein disulfide isomerase